MRHTSGSFSASEVCDERIGAELPREPLAHLRQKLPQRSLLRRRVPAERTGEIAWAEAHDGCLPEEGRRATPHPSTKAWRGDWVIHPAVGTIRRDALAVQRCSSHFGAARGAS